MSQAERANEANSVVCGNELDVADEPGEKMPTDRILDVSPFALRMSSPFNAGYWLAAA